MAKVNFTAGRVADLKCAPGKDRAFLWDASAHGLGLRATANGAKSYIFQSKLQGDVIRITIGSPTIWTIDAAQAEARRLKVLIDAGKDPRQVKADELSEAQEKRDSKEAARLEQLRIDSINDAKRSLIARTAWEDYLAAPHPKWGTQYRIDHDKVANEGGKPNKIGKELSKPAPLSTLLSKPLNEITAPVVREWLADECSTRSTFAHNAYRKLRTFIKWCAKHPEYKHIVHADCCTDDQVKEIIPKNKTKENDCLQKEQLLSWFSAVNQINNLVIRSYLQALLITGSRRNELAQLKWADVDFQWNSMVIRDKVEGLRTIPLTPYVSHLLSKLPRRNEWVFSSPTADKGYIAEPRIAHNQALAIAGLPHITLHGLRRSFGTLSEWIEAPAGVVAQIQGHKPSALAEKHYRRRPIDLLRMWHVKIESWIKLRPIY